MTPEQEANLAKLSGPATPAVSDPVKVAQRDAKAAAQRAQQLAEKKARESTPEALEGKRTRLGEIQADLLDIQVAEELVRQEAKEVAARRRAEANCTGWDLDADALTVTDYAPLAKDTFVTQSLSDMVPGRPLAYSCGLHALFGLPKSGKSWIAAWWAARELAAGRRVLWLDYDNQRSSLGSRLRMCGAANDQIEKHLTYLRPKGRPDMEKLTTQAEGMLVVIDTVGKLQQQAFPGSKSIDYDDYTRVEQEILRPLTEAGCTVVVIDHEAKTNGGTQFGAVSKGGAVDLSWRVVKVDGTTMMAVSEDRHAPFEDGVPVAQLVIKGSSAVLTAEFAQPEVTSGKAINRDIKVLDAVARAPQDYWTTTTLAEHLAETSGDGGKSTWAAHVRDMILGGTVGTAPGTGRTAYLRPPMATVGVAATAGEHQDSSPDPAPILAKLNPGDDYAG